MDYDDLLLLQGEQEIPFVVVLAGVGASSSSLGSTTKFAKALMFFFILPDGDVTSSAFVSVI